MGICNGPLRCLCANCTEVRCNGALPTMEVTPERCEDCLLRAARMQAHAAESTAHRAVAASRLLSHAEHPLTGRVVFHEVRVERDRQAYSLAEFIEWWGEEKGCARWERSRSADMVVRQSALRRQLRERQLARKRALALRVPLPTAMKDIIASFI